jgi:hypothetical protein
MNNIQQQQISQADNKLQYHVVKGFDRFRDDSPESLSMTHRLSPPVSPFPRPPPPPPPPAAPPPPTPAAEESDDDDDELPDELAEELESSEPTAAQNFDMIIICYGSSTN